MTHKTFDMDELSHFKKLSSHWWDTKGPFEQLHAMTPLRMAFLKDKMGIHFRCSENADRKLFKGLRVLDVGCGGGLLCEPLARLGADVTGIDPIQENINMAKGHAEAMGLPITYLTCGIEDIAQETPPFDVIVASELIEHVRDYKGFLKECASCLSPQGGIFISTFNKTIKSYLFGILAAEYVLKLAPRGTHSWDKFVSPQDLSQTLSSLELGDQSLTGIAFSPFKREWSFSSSTEVNYFLWAGHLSEINDGVS
jgi:2-polyprenyl-6-hydroxyphenyl methylase/3-demethylubiquinone-9 3-methyltransferase